MKPSHRLGNSWVALACLVVTAAASHEAFAQICRPVSERTAELGCWITAHATLGELPQQPIFWHLDTYPTRAEAGRAEPSWSLSEKCGFSRSTWPGGVRPAVCALPRSGLFQ